MSGDAPPIAGTFNRLGAFDELCRTDVGADVDDSWVRFDHIAGGGVDALFAAANRSGDRRPDYVGASVASALVDAVVSTALPALLVERRLPDVSPANVAARLHDEEFWFERVSLYDPRCHVLQGDPAAADPTSTVVGSVEEIHQRFAELLVEAATQWFAAIRAGAPFGRRGMWGQLADDVCGSALWAARATGADPQEAWAEAQAILDAIAGVVPELRVRPRLFPVRWSGGEALWQVKGTCCLWYTTFAESDTSGDGYCTTCPLRPDDVRRERLRDWLENQPATTAS